MLGNNLKELRLSKDLTQEDLGKILNKTKNNISQYETGKREPDTETLNKIADFFDVSIDYLLGRSNIKNSNTIEANDIELNLSQKVALKIAENLEQDGYSLEDKDLDDIILAAKVALEQKKRKK